MKPEKISKSATAMALRASELRYRRLFESAKDGILILDAESGVVVDANPFLVELLGFSHEDFLGKKIWELGFFKDIVANQDHFAELQAKDYIRYDNLALETRDGRRIEVEFVSNVYLVEGHRVIQCNIRDISARRRAETALEASASEFRGMFETASIGMAQADPETGRWLRVNQKMCAITGYSMDELLQKKISELTYADDRQRDWDAFQRVVRGEAADYQLEKRYVRKDGSLVWVNVNMTVIRDPAGKPVCTMATIEDITVRRRALESQARLVTAVEQAAETIVITDAKGAIEYANPAFEKVTGYTRAEAIGQNPRVLKSGKHGPEFYRQMWATLNSGQVWNGRIVNKRKDGTLFAEEATISPVFDPAGKIINFVAVKRDITREAELEEQIRHAQRMESIGQLAGGVAHDFNNLLQAILGYCEILINKAAAADTRHGDLLEIQKTGRRAADLTRQLLALGRKQNLDQRVSDINALVEELTSMLQRVIGEDIRIEFDLARNLNRVLIDHSQIGQILLNLAVNARDAMPRGGRLTFKTAMKTYSAADLAAQPGLPAGRFICICVTDTGIGMAPATLERLFEPFFTTKSPGKGTGLGLATSYGIARQHGGWMEAQSDQGHGAAFRLYLPAIESAEEAPVITRMDARATAPPAPTALNGAGRHILLVEDEAVIRSMLQRQLQGNGYTVTAAANAASAVEAFVRSEGHIDLILTDVILPDRTGLELLADLTARQPGLRVLVSSGYTDNEKRWPLIRQRK